VGAGHAFLLLAALQAPASEPADEDWTWLQSNRDAVYDALMPLRVTDSEFITYRAYRDAYYTFPERYFQIRLTTQGPLASLLRPEGKSIQAQLLDLHMADPAIPLERLLPRVRVKRFDLEGKGCGAIERQVAKLHEVAFHVPTRNLLVLHPDMHRIIVSIAAGDLDALLTEDAHPLVRWAMAAEEAFYQCGNSGGWDERRRTTGW
jgi:hypothetical protein